MTATTLPRLAAVKTQPSHQLELTFIDGSVRTVSLAEAFDRFPALLPLRDPAAFARAVVVAGEGWTVEWPELDIQIGADTLWRDAQAQAQDASDARPQRPTA